MESTHLVPNQVLSHWGLNSAKIIPIKMGLINKTFLLKQPDGKFILQKVNPIFDPQVHLDILAVTEHLNRAGLTTPRLQATHDACYWVADPQGGIWRLLSHIDGRCYSSVQRSKQAYQAGLLLGRFHLAVSDLKHDFKFARPGVHHTPRHMQRLADALVNNRTHRLINEAQFLAERILKSAESKQIDTRLPRRIVHGDPKVGNILFADDHTSICLIDLDTLAKRSTVSELGDAFRSWCATTDKQGRPIFSLNYFKKAVEGYCHSGVNALTHLEPKSLVLAVETISLELAARYCMDILCECHFAWDASRFEDAAAHNLHRAQKQFDISRSILEQHAQMESLVNAIL